MGGLESSKDKSHSFRRHLLSWRHRDDNSGTPKQPTLELGNTQNEEQHPLSSSRPRITHAPSSPLTTTMAGGNDTSHSDAPTVDSHELTHTVSVPNISSTIRNYDTTRQHSNSLAHARSTSPSKTSTVGGVDSLRDLAAVLKSDRSSSLTSLSTPTPEAKNTAGSQTIVSSAESEKPVEYTSALPSDAEFRLVRRQTQAIAGDNVLLPGKSSLWSIAYTSLSTKNDAKARKLVQKYEILLQKQLLSSSDSSNNTKVNKEGFESTGSHQYMSIFDPSQQRAQLRTMLEKSKEVHESKGKIIIRNHSIDIQSAIAKAASGAKFAKGLIDEAVKASPEASIVWSVVCLALPLLTRPVEAETANLDGLEYVSSRMQFYIAIEELLFPSRVSAASKAAREGLGTSLVKLYEHVLDFQIRSILRLHDSNWFNDVFTSTDWQDMQSQIEKLESTINQDSILINNNESGPRLQRLLQAANEAREELKELYRQGIKALEQLNATATEQSITQKQMLELMQKQHEEQEEKELRDKTNKCLQSLLRRSPYEKFLLDVHTRVPGTCCWFLDQSDYKEWLKSPGGCLLVSADPGCGKSVLARYLIETELPDSGRVVCYFFFKDQIQNTFAPVLAALLHQLLKQRRDLAQLVMEFYDEDPEQFADNITMLSRALSRVLVDPRIEPIIFVLDALDECKSDDMERLLDWIAGLDETKAGPSTHKFLLTTRPYGRIVDDFEHKTRSRHIHIQGQDKSKQISDEVKLVIRYRCSNLLERKRIKAEVHEELCNSLLAQDNNTYLFVYLIFKELEEKDNLRKQSLKKFKEWFSKLPHSVDDAYEHMLSKNTTDPETRRVVVLVLHIMLASYRPLTVSEIQCAVKADLESPSLHEDLDLDDVDDFKDKLQSWCGLFVQVHDSKATFLHQTARDFLLRREGDAKPQESTMWAHSINLVEAHALLGRVCMAYLLLGDFKETLKLTTFSSLVPSTSNHNSNVSSAVARRKSLQIDDIETLDKNHVDDSISSDGARASHSNLEHQDVPQVERENLQDSNPIISDPEPKDAWVFNEDESKAVCTDYPFLEYASSQWEGHVISGHCDHDKRVLDNALALYDDKAQTFSNWTKASSVPISLWMDDLDARFHQPKPLAVAAGFSSSAIFALLLKETDLTTDLKLGEAALLTAIARNQEDNAILLLESGINPKCLNRLGITALSTSITQSLTSVAKQLLARGADADVKDLCSAVRYDDVQILMALLEHNLDVNANDGDGWAALHHAAMNKSSKAVELLLAHGVDVNTRALNEGMSALHLAAMNGNVDIVQSLLDHKADIDMRNDQGYTPLPLAALDGHLSIVKILLEHNAEPDVVDNYGNTALTIAANGGYHDVIEALLPYKPNINHGDKDGYTSLHFAARSGYDKTVEMLLSYKADPEVQTEYGSTPLQLAAQFGYSSVVELLLRHKADAAISDSLRWTPLITASNQGHLEVVKVLLDHDAKVNEHDDEGNTALHHAAFDGFHKIANLLLIHGAEVNLTNNQRKTAMHIAADGVHIEYVKMLLDCGADVNLADYHGNTTLSYAAANGGLEMAQLLLQYDADPNILDADEDNAVMCAAADGHLAMVQLLLDHQGAIRSDRSNAHTALHCAAGGLARETMPETGNRAQPEDYIAIMKLLLNAGLAIDEPNNNGATPLMLAASRLDYHRPILEYLTEANADVHARDKEGNTCMHYIYNEEVLEILVKYGGDLNAQNVDGQTPLLRVALDPHWNEAEESSRVTKLYRTMVEQGADLRIKDSQGLYPPICLEGLFSTSCTDICLEDKMILKASCKKGDEAVLGSIDLNSCLAVEDDGSFIWTHDGNFSARAKDIKLIQNGRILQAELSDGEGVWRLAYVWLDEEITNDNGVLKFVSRISKGP